MNQKKRGLGRGLGDLGLTELLSDMHAPQTSVLSADTLVAPVSTHAPAQATPQTGLCQLAVSELTPGRYQPRKHMDEEGLEELAESIRAQGIIQPIVVRRMNDRYEIIAGERRWRAAQRAGLSEVPVIIRDISDETALAVALIENIQRRDLNAIEEATALQRLIAEFSMTHQEVATAVGKTRTAVTNLLRLLKLNPEVRAMVETGKLEMGHARALLSLTDMAQTKAAELIVTKGLSVRETEQMIRQWQQPQSTQASTSHRTIDPNIRRLQDQLSLRLNASVEIMHGDKGRGKLVVAYHSLDELDGILDHLVGDANWRED